MKRNGENITALIHYRGGTTDIDISEGAAIEITRYDADAGDYVPYSYMNMAGCLVAGKPKTGDATEVPFRGAVIDYLQTAHDLITGEEVIGVLGNEGNPELPDAANECLHRVMTLVGHAREALEAALDALKIESDGNGES